MASIRLTSRIKSEIKINASALFTKRIQTAADSLRLDFWDDVTQAVYDEFYYPYSELNVPDTWMIDVKEIRLHIDTQFIPYKKLNKSYRMIHLHEFFTGDILDIADTQVPFDFKKEYRIYNNKIKTLNEERIEFSNQLNKVLNNCNTLTQFLKIWPQGEHLLDGIDFEQTVVKRKKKEVTVSEDTLSKLNTGLLKQTMLNS